MWRTSHVLRRVLAAFLLAPLLAINLAPWGRIAAARSVDFSLNVFYSTPTNNQSAGTWQLVAKSSQDTFGIAGFSVDLTGVNLPAQVAGPRGIVNGSDPAGFSEFNALNLTPGIVTIIAGQTPVAVLQNGEEQSVFYGIGKLANGSPDFPGKPAGSTSLPSTPTFVSLTNTNGLPWATGDPLSNVDWNSAALFATGTFAAGSIPAFVSGNLFAQVFTSVGTSTNIGALATVQDITSIVRTNFVVPGGSPDYNHNGVVDAADYTVWRDTLGSTTVFDADGINDHIIDQADYEFWKLHFGEVINPGGAASGDYNSNGVVDAADYPVWRDTLGYSGSGLAADGSGNGAVDMADYDLWKSKFGTIVPGGGSSNGGTSGGLTSGEGVPEPTSGALVAGTGFLLFLRLGTRVLRNM